MAEATAFCKCCKCGKHFEKTVYRDTFMKAQSYARWLSNRKDRVCLDCYSRMQFSRTAHETAGKILDKGPILTGTTQQICWAEKLREKFVRKVIMSNRYSTEEKDRCVSMIVSRRKAASWWIRQASQICSETAWLRIVENERLMIELDLPLLYGSVAQVQWAEQLREEFIAENKKNGILLNKTLQEHTDAVWWIKNRKQNK